MVGSVYNKPMLWTWKYEGSMVMCTENEDRRSACLLSLIPFYDLGAWFRPIFYSLIFISFFDYLWFFYLQFQRRGRLFWFLMWILKWIDFDVDWAMKKFIDLFNFLFIFIVIFHLIYKSYFVKFEFALIFKEFKSYCWFLVYEI